MPLAGKYLLDTNAIIAALRDEKALMGLLDDASEVLIPVIAAGELHYSAFLSPRPNANRAVISALFEQIRILPCDLQTAFFYGQLKSELLAANVRLPENDLWIGALARQHDAQILAYDPALTQLPGIQVQLLFA